MMIMNMILLWTPAKSAVLQRCGDGVETRDSQDRRGYVNNCMIFWVLYAMLPDDQTRRARNSDFHASAIIYKDCNNAICDMCPCIVADSTLGLFKGCGQGVETKRLVFDVPLIAMALTEGPGTKDLAYQ